MAGADDPDDGAQGHLLAVFPCNRCDQPAATVRLAPDGQLVVEALMGRITQRVAADDQARVGAILARRDAPALYAINAEWASFYCPACDRSYCRAHWRLDVRYDDDFPGWYDCTYGTCPTGHTRLIDD